MWSRSACSAGSEGRQRDCASSLTFSHAPHSLRDSPGFKVTLMWLPDFRLKKKSVGIHVQEWQHLIHSKPRNWSYECEAMSCKLRGVIISDGGVLGPGGKSREYLCCEGPSTEGWAELSGEKLGLPFHLPYCCTGEPENPGCQHCLLLTEGCAVSCPYFTRKSQSRSSHSAKPPNVPSVPVAPVTEAQLLIPPIVGKRLSSHTVLKPQPVRCG